MNIQPSTTVNQAASQQRSEVKVSEEKIPADNVKEQPSAREMSQANRQQVNQTILQSQLEISLKSDNKSMSLLYKTITSAIEESFSEEQTNKATETASVPASKYGQQEDTSPEATAERIVAFATNFYSYYREQNKDEPEEEVLNRFMQKIGGAIDQGFKDARDILTSLQKLDGKVKEDVDATYELVQQGLLSFRERTLEQSQQAKDATLTQ